MLVDDAHERDVSAFREARMPLDPGAQRAPVDFEIIDEDSALRIPDIQGRTIPIFDSSGPGLPST